eukprot:scaffold3461_cov116-Isochrysis_galbana.AAC.6
MLRPQRLRDERCPLEWPPVTAGPRHLQKWYDALRMGAVASAVAVAARAVAVVAEDVLACAVGWAHPSTCEPTTNGGSTSGVGASPCRAVRPRGSRSAKWAPSVECHRPQRAARRQRLQVNRAAAAHGADAGAAASAAAASGSPRRPRASQSTPSQRHPQSACSP